ncbi:MULTISPECIES: hypothetical protein [Thiorhodovibrio]|uniref:hypothetical protein n=1 Tax=Thiorhodovibrio TaxID=61593 RepID=UPI001913D1F4|nr:MULTISPECIES: hypothetical protein [Thiorhodovibrio]
MINKYKKSPPIKISDAILRMAEPLIRRYPKRERIVVIIDLAIFSWNVSLTTEVKREEIERKLIDQMPDAFNATDIASIIEQTDILIERKKELYPDINYLIVSHNLSVEDNGQISLDVNTIKQ